MKIVELYIDMNDEESGTETLSLVHSPATHQQWMIFSDDHNCDGKCQLHSFTSEGEDMDYFIQNSISVRVENTTTDDFKIEGDKFYTINSTPNQLQPGDGNLNEVVRYYYVVDVGLGPNLKASSRTLCRQLIGADLLYREADLVRLSAELTADPDSRKLVPRTQGTNVDLKIYKAGKYCRHLFKKVIFTLQPDVELETFVSRIPKRARQAINSRPRPIIESQSGRGGESEYKIYKESFNLVGFIDGEPVFSTPQEAELYGKNTVGCKGYHSHQDEDGNEVYMACESHPQNKVIGLLEGLIVYSSVQSLIENEPSLHAISKIAYDGVEGFIGVIPSEDYFTTTQVKILSSAVINETFYNDYPDSAKNAASSGIKRNENLGNPCATLTGKNRARQIEKGENLSLETIKRTYSYLSRAYPEYKKAKDRQDYDACAYISFLLWGGESMLNYSERIINQNKEELTQHFGCVQDLLDKGYGEEEARYKCYVKREKSIGKTDVTRLPNNYLPLSVEDDKNMVDGIVDILVQVEDMEDRKKIAEDMIKQFAEDGIEYDINDFLQRIGLLGQIELNNFRKHIFRDEFKREITAVVMEPNKYIARKDKNGDLYYVFFTVETVKQMSQKFFKQNRHKEFNYEHTGLMLEGGYVFESWLVNDPENDKSKSLGFSVNPGTWIVTFKWDDKELFEKYILSQKTLGISLEGNFLSRNQNFTKSVETKDKIFIDRVIQLLDKLK